MGAEFAVIGLGQFGHSVAVNIANEGGSVLAVDKQRERVQNVASRVDAAVRADTSDEEALSDVGIETVSCAVVAIGSNSMESSMLTTALLRQFGVPRIIARATSQLHGRVLTEIGAHEIIDPEKQMGYRLARRLSHPNVVDQSDIGDAHMAEIAAPESFVGDTLVDRDVRNEYGISVLAIQRGEHVNPNPKGDAEFQSGDILYVIGPREAIRRVADL
jgi:trk system potassium uptake protein TrkA